MKKIAVVIKHMYRDYDYRVDVYNVEDGVSLQHVHDYAKSKMIGPFEIISVTEKFCLRENLILTLTPKTP